MIEQALERLTVGAGCNSPDQISPFHFRIRSFAHANWWPRLSLRRYAGRNRRSGSSDSSDHGASASKDLQGNEPHRRLDHHGRTFSQAAELHPALREARRHPPPVRHRLRSRLIHAWPAGCAQPRPGGQGCARMSFGSCSLSDLLSKRGRAGKRIEAPHAAFT